MIAIWFVFSILLCFALIYRLVDNIDNIATISIDKGLMSVTDDQRNVFVSLEDIKEIANREICFIAFSCLSVFVAVSLLITIIYTKVKKELYASEKNAEENAHRFKMAFETSSIGMTIVSPNGKFLEVNSSMISMLGYTAEEFKTLTFQELTLHEDLQKDIVLYKKVLSGEINDYQIEKRFLHKNGKIIKAILSTSLVRDDNEQPLYFVSQVHDITKRKEAEAALEESEKMFSVIYEKSPNALILMDMQTNKIIEINKSFTNIFGYTPEEIVGTAHNMTNYGISKSEQQRLIDIVKQKGKLLNERTKATTKTGNVIDIMVSTTVISLDGRQVYLSDMVDITESIKAQKNLLIAKQEAEKANKLKSEFLAKMSHEIRTPMNAVLGYAEILSDKLPDNEEYRDLIKGITKGGQSLISLINDILDLSKIEAGYLKINPFPVNIIEVIKGVEQIFALEIQKKKLQFLFEYQNDLPTTLYIDQLRVRQILLNLLGNAIKFTDSGTVGVKLLFEGNAAPESLINLSIEVWDTGIGIDSEKFETIFLAFRQADEKYNKYGGTGLGLAITRHLVEAMNGEILVISKLGEGTVFKVILKDIIVTSIQPYEDVEIVNVLNETTERIKFNKPKILLICNSKKNKKFLNILIKTNCRVKNESIVDYDTSEVEILDLVIIDYIQTTEETFLLLEQLLKIFSEKNTPIILVVDLLTKKDLKSILLQTIDVLIRPVEAIDFIRSMKKYLAYTYFEEENVGADGTANKPDTIADLSNILSENKKLKIALYGDFEKEVKPLIDELLDIMDVEDGKRLGEIIINLGKKYDLDVLIHFGNDLLSKIKSFRLGQLESLFEIFSDFIVQLKQNIYDGEKL